MKRCFLLLLIIITFITCSFLTAETVKEHIAALLKDAPTPGKNGLTKKLPYKVIDAKLGFFGLFAILKFDDQACLGIFNIAQGKFQKMLNLKSTHFKFATGGSVLLIFYPDTDVIELWNLQTMKKIKTKKILIDNGFLLSFIMASELESKVLVGGVEDGKMEDECFYGILNLKTFELIKFKNDQLFDNRQYDDDIHIHIRCNRNMTKALLWHSSLSPSGFQYIFLSHTPPTYKYVSSSFGALNFSNNDHLVVSTLGGILNTDATVVKSYSKSLLFPVIGDDFYIQYKLYSKKGEPNLIVRDLNSHKEVTTLTTDFEIERETSGDPDFTVDRTLMASKISDRIFIIDNENQKVRIYPLGISGKSNSLESIPKAFVGQKWICKLKYPKGTNVVIEDGPEGMTFNTDSNTLIWDKPAAEGVQDVLLNITKPQEEEFYKEIKVVVKKK